MGPTGYAIKWLMIVVTFIIGGAMLAVGVSILLGPDVVTQSCNTEHSNLNSFLPFLVGGVLLIGAGFAASMMDNG